jgi:hypothetical protein
LHKKPTIFIIQAWIGQQLPGAPIIPPDVAIQSR